MNICQLDSRINYQEYQQAFFFIIFSNICREATHKVKTIFIKSAKYLNLCLIFKTQSILRNLTYSLQLIYLGIHLSFGIMFSQKLTQMGLSSSTTSWIFNLYNFMFNLSAVFGTTLCDAFSWRSVGFSCGLVSGLTFTLMIFVEGPGLMFLLFSIILGEENVHTL